MTNTPYERAAIAVAALKLIPPLIRKSLLNDRSFREEYGLKTEAMISFGASGVSVQRSELFDAVRAVLAGEAAAELTDAEDRNWNLTNDDREGSFQILSSHPMNNGWFCLTFLCCPKMPLYAFVRWKNLLQT